MTNNIKCFNINLFNFNLKLKIIIPGLFFVCAANAAAADIFRCQNQDGKPIFSDSPCESGQTLVEKVELKASTVIESNPDKGPSGGKTKNLVKNSGFESSVESWALPEDARWESSAGMGDSAAVSLSAQKRENDKYGQETEITQCVLLDNSPMFVLAADVYLLGIPSRNVANRIHLIWYATKDCSTGGQWAHYLEPKPISSWQRLKSRPLKPSMGAKAAKIRLVQKGKYAENSRALWDNIKLQGSLTNVVSTAGGQAENIAGLLDAPLGYNLVDNSGFDFNLESWRNSSRAKWERNTGKLKKGSVRIEVNSTKTGLGTGVLSQCVKLASGRNYVLSANVLKDIKSTQAGGGRLRLTWNSAEDCRGQSSTSNQHADFENKIGWQKIEVNNLKAPVAARAATIELIQSVAAAGTFAVYWDDVELVLTKD